MTFREWVEYCQRALESSGAWFGHGTANPADEAAWLVLHVIGAPLDGSFRGWNEMATEAQGSEISELVNERIGSRRPLAYVIGEAWFCGLKFYVDDRVLVPRSPIGELIGHQFSPWVDATRMIRMLDLCTGSGCIGIAAAVHMPWLKVDASDISKDAIRVADINRQAHGVEDRVELIESDIFSALDGRTYDLIVSNPPYVSDAAFETLPAEYHEEPAMALVSECQGLEIPLEILLRASDYLVNDGVLICEVGENATLLSQLLPGLPVTWLEFENGGEGVFTIGREQLLVQRPAIGRILEKLRDVA